MREHAPVLCLVWFMLYAEPRLSLSFFLNEFLKFSPSSHFGSVFVIFVPSVQFDTMSSCVFVVEWICVYICKRERRFIAMKCET